MARHWTEAIIQGKPLTAEEAMEQIGATLDAAPGLPLEYAPRNALVAWTNAITEILKTVGAYGALDDEDTTQLTGCE